MHTRPYETGAQRALLGPWRVVFGRFGHRLCQRLPHLPCQRFETALLVALVEHDQEKPLRKGKVVAGCMAKREGELITYRQKLDLVRADRPYKKRRPR